jgi:hypothetical protein
MNGKRTPGSTVMGSSSIPARWWGRRDCHMTRGWSRIDWLWRPRSRIEPMTAALAR